MPLMNVDMHSTIDLKAQLINRNKHDFVNSINS